MHPVSKLFGIVRLPLLAFTFAFAFASNARAETFEHPLIGADLLNPKDLSPTNSRIISETLDADGTTLLTIACDVLNAGEGKWRFVKVGRTATASADMAIVSGSSDVLEFDTVEPNGTTLYSDNNPLVIRVQPAQLAAVKSSLADNSALRVTEGRELFRTNVPIAAATSDADFEIASDGTSPVTMTFTPSFIQASRISTATGTFMPFFPTWIEDAETMRTDLNREVLIVPESAFALSNTYTFDGAERAGPSHSFPFLYSSHAEEFPLPPFIPYGEIRGRAIEDMLPYIEYGTFAIDLTEPGSPGFPEDKSTVTAGVDADGDRSGLPETVTNKGGKLAVEMTASTIESKTFKAVPLHFDKLRLSEKLSLSGSISLEAMPLAVEMRIRPTGNEIEVSMGVVAEANLLLETDDAVDTSLQLDESLTAQILKFQAWQLVIPTPLLKLYVTPEIELAVGASVEGAAGLSIPFSARFEAVSTFGWKNGAFFYNEPAITSKQPATSPLSSYIESSVTARLWAESNLIVHLSTDPENLTSDAAPEISVRAEASVSTDPLANPWWSSRGDLSVDAKFELNALGFQLADVETNLGSWEIFASDSGTGLPAEILSATESANPGVRPLGKGHSRWGRVLDYRADSSGATWSGVDILPIAGTDEILMGGWTSQTEGGVHRVDARGKWISSITFDHPAALAPKSFVGEPGGGFTVAGKSGIHYGLQKLNSEGVSEWTTMWDLDGSWGIEIEDLLRQELPNGDVFYYVVGYVDDGPLVSNNAYVAKFDSSGTVLWSKRYTVPEGQLSASRTFTAGCIGADGNLLLSGSASKEALQPSGITGWIVKVDSADGAPIQTSGIAGPRILTVSDIIEAPDQNLYISGGHLGVVGDDSGSIVVSKFGPDGKMIKTLQIAKESSLQGEYPSSGGGTPYDNATSIAWTPDGLWISGTLDIGANSSGFVALLDESLGVLRNVVFGGGDADTIRAMLLHDDGIYVGGYTRSFSPWPEGGAIPTRAEQWLLSLPWDGMMRFHNRTSAAQPKGGETATTGAYYIWPQVWNSTAYTDWEEGISQHDMPLEARVSTPIDPEFSEVVTVRAIEYIPSQALSFQDYIEYSQFPDDDPVNAPDTDGDGVNDALEHFLGTDPDRNDQPDTLELTNNIGTDTASLCFTRAHNASDGIPTIETSTDLVNWTLRDDWTATAEQHSETLDLVKIILPLDPGAPRLYVRLGIPSYATAGTN